MSERDYEAMDPATVGELRRLLEGVDGMWSRLEAALRAPVAPGSMAAADDALPDARFVSMYAGQAVSTAIDHLNTWRLLVYGPLIPIGAHLTLLRGALEGAARSRWHIDARRSSGIRVGRGHAARRDDQEERAKYEASREGAPHPARTRGLSAVERLAQLDDPDPEEARERREAAGIRPVGFTDTTSLMITYGHERLFRLASGVAHGKEWALEATDVRLLSDPSPTPGLGHGIVSASDSVAVAMTTVTVGAVRAALAELEAYRSTPADRAGRGRLRRPTPDRRT